ncbi:MAG: hypothetical protein DRH93_08375 [Deltaproteobacteria bacterium]|nr:MAG: hypothetical protein DRH93_08375 [Deltaproteobacteria bacterium]
MKRKFKRRRHKTTGGDFKIDIYPEIDRYIPDAELEANMGVKADKTLSWNTLFNDAMDRILKQKGLRV